VRHHLSNFKTGALNHSATLPLLRHQSLGAAKIKNRLATMPPLSPRIGESQQVKRRAFDMPQVSRLCEM
jgi:hypothetical protein